MRSLETVSRVSQPVHWLASAPRSIHPPISPCGRVGDATQVRADACVYTYFRLACLRPCRRARSCPGRARGRGGAAGAASACRGGGGGAGGLKELTEGHHQAWSLRLNLTQHGRTYQVQTGGGLTD
jgi:hypothetical protein